MDAADVRPHAGFSFSRPVRARLGFTAAGRGRAWAVSRIDLENTFDFLSPDYWSLFERARATAFQHPIWLDRLYRKLAPDLDAEPLVVTARSPAGRLEMVLPLVRRRHKGLRMIEFADLQVSDYAWAVCDEADFRALAGDARTGESIRDLLRPYDVLRIKKVPDGAPRLEQLFETSRRSRMDVSAHAAALSEPFASWQAAAMPGSYVRELARKRRRLARDGALTFERLRDPALIEEAFGLLRTWRAQRFPDNLLQQELYYVFYREIAVAGAQSGFSRTFRLALDDRTIGVVWGVCSRGTCVMLMEGFDPAYKNRSIGALAFEDLARDCVAEHDRVLDFSIGDEAYKQLFGCRPSPLSMISASGTPLGLIANSVVARLPQWAARARPKGEDRPSEVRPN